MQALACSLHQVGGSSQQECQAALHCLCICWRGCAVGVATDCHPACGSNLAAHQEVTSACSCRLPCAFNSSLVLSGAWARP